MNKVNRPLLSVLMPCYNENTLVAKAIESILNQTFGDFEFIIFDDKSTDGTEKIIEKYASQDSRIVYIKNAKNIGYAASLNRGIEIAKSDIIARMDSDDFSYPNRFEKQYQFLSTHQDVDIVGTSARLINRINGNVIKDCHLHESHEQIIKNRYTTSFNFHPTIMARKNLFTEMGGYDTSILRSEEYDLWLRAYKNFRFHNLQEVLLDYTVKNSTDLLKFSYFKSALEIKIKHMKENEGIARNIPLLSKIILAYSIKRLIKKTYI